MSAINLDEPGFTAPANSTAPPSSDSSVDQPPEGRRKCVACPRRISAKTADRHTICVVCRGFDCSIDSRCEECIEWPEEGVRLYPKMRKSLKSKGSSKHRNKPSASPLPAADSVPSSQLTAIAHMQTQVDSHNALVNTLSGSLFARMDALTASLASSIPQSSSQTRLGNDADLPQPGQTAGESRTFQVLGVNSRTSARNAQSLGQGVRAPHQEYVGPSAAPQPHAAPGPAPQPSASFVPLQPPPRYEDPPPQPSTSGWVPSGPHPPRSRGSRNSSESEASETESEVSARDSASARLANLIYEVCPDSRPLSDAARQPRCGFEGWFGQPESVASRQHFRLYPRVGEVEAHAEALARRSKPLSQLLPSCSRRHAVADRPLYASSLIVNPSFAQLAGAKAVGTKRWGSISFSEMERLERMFRSQLEMMSSSLWLMSGILAMLKRDGSQPADPTLFNAALASASAALSQQARTSASGSAFLRSKRRVSLLTHTAIPVPEAQRRALMVSPGSESSLFNEEILSVVVAQVQQSSMISSNLAVSRSLGRGKGRSSSSSPLVDPSPSGSSRSGKPHGKRSTSSSCYGGRKRSRGGKGLAPSSRPSGFRK